MNLYIIKKSLQVTLFACFLSLNFLSLEVFAQGDIINGENSVSPRELKLAVGEVAPIFPANLEVNPSLVMETGVKDEPAIPYPSIRDIDIVYRQRVWEEIDSRQKINLPFSPKRVAEGPSTMRFIDVIYEGLRSRQIKAYDANDERFTRELSDEEIVNIVKGKPDTVEVVDATDPRGLRRIKKIQYNKPDKENILKVRIIEDWLFDRINSRFICRIIGIAPVLSLYNDAGSYLGDRPLFWIYYPDARDFLNSYKVINWKNYQQSVSWQQMLELRYFAGTIIQTTLDNPLGLRLLEYIKDPRERLIEGEKIRSQIFDYEQSMWEY